MKILCATVLGSLLTLAACQPALDGAAGSKIYAMCKMASRADTHAGGPGAYTDHRSCVTIVTQTSPVTSTPTNTVPVTVTPGGIGMKPIP